MTNKECIHDLKLIKEEFEKESGGCSPVCLDKAISIIEKVGKELNRPEFIVEDLPEVKRRKAHWHMINPSKVYECSACGGYILTDKIDVYRYCHHCGAEMTEKEIEFGNF